MSKFIDLTGQRFGRLVVIEKTDKRDGSKRVIWKCQCDCGSIKDVSSACLIGHQVMSCGCLLKEKREQHKLKLIGQSFGDLTVIDKVNSNSNYTMWKCRCVCGEEIIVRGNNLTYGNTTNCGCNRRNKTRYINHIDLCGQKFGKLTVVKETDRRSANGNIIWQCLCDCGESAFVDTGSLQSGNTRSCGCVQSQGELKIRQILEESHIKFQTHYSFDDCKDINALPFDFFINNEYLIEYDGIQHFIATNNGWNTDAHLESVKQHDLIKNNYCKTNNIPLIRIPYTHYNDICLKDLLLDTTMFLINKEINK